MKILYAVQGTGNGHLSRAIALVPEFQKYGDVDVLISGTQSQIEFPFEVKYRFQGLSFVSSKNGGVNILKTLFSIKPLRFFREMKSLPVDQYDLIVTDFEPVSAWACRFKRVPCIELSHQAAVKNPKSPQTHRAFPLGRWIVKNYCPASSAIGFHFDTYTENTYFPILRKEIVQGTPIQGDYYVVYLSGYGDAQLLSVFQHVDAPFIIFSKDVKSPSQRNNCTLKPISNDVFMNDLMGCKGVICGAGFELPAEALYLNKKVMVVPYSNHYEQHCNATALHQMGVSTLFTLDKSSSAKVQGWCENSEPIVYDWKDQLEFVVQRVVRDHKQAVGAIKTETIINR
jgi:uncharacterized protein (TIGR00661 family)